MDFDVVQDWYWDALDWLTSIEFGFLTDWLSDLGDRFTFLEFLSFGDDVDQFSLLLSLGIGGMLSYFWLVDPANMGMNLIPLYLRLSAIVISTVFGYYFANKLLGG